MNLYPFLGAVCLFCAIIILADGLNTEVGREAYARIGLGLVIFAASMIFTLLGL